MADDLHTPAGRARGVGIQIDLLPVAAWDQPRVTSSAVLSPCGRYRYRLERRWGVGPALLWVMLNPSTADAEQDDPTIRRVVGFTRREGFGAAVVCNLFARRATDPAVLRTAGDHVGPDNDHTVCAIASTGRRSCSRPASCGASGPRRPGTPVTRSTSAATSRSCPGGSVADRYAGIDPGRTGALVVIGDDGMTVARIVEWHDSSEPPYLLDALAGVLRIAVEGLHVGKGRRSSITLAEWTGRLLAELPPGVPVERPQPSKWRGAVLRRANLRTDDAKAAAIRAARPHLGLGHDPSSHVAEAWCLARYAWGVHQRMLR